MLLENLLSSTNATSLSSTYISGIPVLAHACFMNKHAVTEILLEHKANPNVVVGDEPLLHIAYRISDKEILTLLLEHGAHPNAVDREYRTTLSKSIELEDQKERLELLISHGADVNAIDHRGRTPLHYATEDVNLVAVSTLLLHYADPDAIDKEGNTPLHLLPYYHAEIVQEFVDEFADFSLTNEKGSVEHYLCSMISSGKK
jgi:ankyrin repeat protein